MASFTEPARKCEALLSYGNGAVSFETITVVSGAGVVKAGTVLGKITASGKYTPYDDGLSNGAQVAVCVSMAEVDATSSDKTVSAIMRMAEVKKDVLFWHASADATAKATAYVDLAKNQMIVAR